MTDVRIQDRLPLGEEATASVREDRAEAMIRAGIRPPQRYEVSSDDRFEPVKPRRSPLRILSRLIRRWR